MPTNTTEADIIFNKANVALARSQHLIASWLPPRTAEEFANTKSEEEIEKEEREMFTPVPELLGLGAPLPKDIPDGDRRRQELSSNDKLRKQLLGKGFPKLQARVLEKSKVGSGGRQVFARPRTTPVKRQLEEEEEEEEGGRSSLGKSKRQMVKVGSPDGGDEVDDDARPSSNVKAIPTGNDGGRKSASNYLDEVLAEKSQKRRRNKKRKKESAKLEPL